MSPNAAIKCEESFAETDSYIVEVDMSTLETMMKPRERTLLVKETYHGHEGAQTTAFWAKAFEVVGGLSLLTERSVANVK
ncbi:hypothetical protein AAF712_010963 [Marasmius tenuissimus]|uniref:Uncharacterized protein n=1 Tax=Marasmius tenuissimus TaxID=585030 RepID=A0ABR2ZP96_9AGAR